MSGVSCYSSFVVVRDFCVLEFGWIHVVWRKIPLSCGAFPLRGTKKVSGTRYSTQWKTPQKWTVPYRAVPCSGKAPLEADSPWVPERAPPWRPPVLSPCPLRPPEHVCWGGGVVMSELCPHVLCFPSSCAHIWSVFCSLLVLLISSLVCVIH